VHRGLLGLPKTVWWKKVVIKGMADCRNCESSLDTSHHDLDDNFIGGGFGFGRIGTNQNGVNSLSSQREQTQPTPPPPPYVFNDTNEDFGTMNKR
jgi:hypothetical protein